MSNKKYDHDKAENLENYVRMKYGNQLSNGAMRFYLLALPHLEKKRCGLCAPITADYRQLARAGMTTPRYLSKTLDELSGVLCEVKKGQPINGGGIATMIRRYSLRELQSTELKRKLVITTPDHANRLAAVLNERSFMYGGEKCSPHWKINKTGRIQSEKPNVQGDSEATRIDSLKAGLRNGETLFSIDFKQAEPTTIQRLIGHTFPEPPYEALAAIDGTTRDMAKGKVNMLAYANSARSIVKHWQPDAQTVFMPYAVALDNYKEKLWDTGKPREKKRRFVHTVGGTRIEATRGDEVHRGTVLNWHVQGTIADIVNGACLEVIDRESSEGWRLCFPVHDSMYVIGQPHHRGELEGVMKNHAKRLNLELTVKTKEATRC